MDVALDTFCNGFGPLYPVLAPGVNIKFSFYELLIRDFLMEQPLPDAETLDTLFPRVRRQNRSKTERIQTGFQFFGVYDHEFCNGSDSGEFQDLPHQRAEQADRIDQSLLAVGCYNFKRRSKDPAKQTRRFRELDGFGICSRGATPTLTRRLSVL